MKILYVNKASPYLGGGAELRLLEIGWRLVAKGHSVHVICAKTEPGLPDYQQVNGINVHYLDLLPDSIFRFKRISFYLSRYSFYPATICLGEAIARISPEIIVDYVSPSPSLVYLWARRFYIPCSAEVMEYRGWQWFRLQSPITALLGLISEWFLRKFPYENIITISNFTKQELERAGFASGNIVVVPCGVDTEKFRNKTSVARRSNSLIFVGRLVPLKGHRYLLDALTHVREQVANVKLFIVGDGPIRPELELHVRDKGLEDNVVFTGRVTEEEKASLLWASSVFVTPSLQEGFGIVLLEAMACGLPIIAFDLPVYRELMDSHCGFLIRLKDSHAMAMQIARLLQDHETREKISLHNLKHAQQFRWDTMAELEEQVLRSVIEDYSVSQSS
jgi:glycosyltransferase involved in cell wall biosynthesis